MSEARHSAAVLPGTGDSFVALMLASFLGGALLTIVQYAIYPTAPFDPRIFTPLFVVLFFGLHLMLGFVPSALILLIPRRFLAAPSAIAFGLAAGYYAMLARNYFSMPGPAPLLPVFLFLIGTALPVLAGWWIAWWYINRVCRA